MGNFVLNFSKALAAAGGVVTISDLMQPLAPICAYIIPISLVAFILLYLIRNRDDWVKVAMHFSGLLFVLSLTVFIFQKNSVTSGQKGVLGAKFSILESLQKDLSVVKGQAEKIAINTKSIAVDVKALKKETSVDPRKELANLGLKWTRENFLEVIRQDDTYLVELYAKGGMTLWIDADYFSAYLSIMSDEVARILAKYKSYEKGKYCGLIYNIEPMLKQIKGKGKREFIKGVCVEDIDAVDSAVNREKITLKKNRVSNSNLKSAIKSCITNLNKVSLEKFYVEASRFDTMKSISTPRDEVLSKLFLVMTIGGDSFMNNTEAFLKKTIKETCSTYYSKISVDDGRLQGLIKMRQVLSGT